MWSRRLGVVATRTFPGLWTAGMGMAASRSLGADLTDAEKYDICEAYQYECDRLKDGGGTPSKWRQRFTLHEMRQVCEEHHQEERRRDPEEAWKDYQQSLKDAQEYARREEERLKREATEPPPTTCSKCDKSLEHNVHARLDNHNKAAYFTICCNVRLPQHPTIQKLSFYPRYPRPGL